MPFIPNRNLTTEFDAPQLPETWQAITGYQRLPGTTDARQIAIENGVAHFTVTPLNAATYATPLLVSNIPMHYGRIEIRAKIAETNAVQAVWLYGEEGGVAREIDLFEIAPAAEGWEHALQTNWHRIESDGDQPASTHHLMDPQSHTSLAYDPLEWHTYALEWTPTAIFWYLDGRPLRIEANLDFHTPLNLFIGAEIHANWLGLPEEKTLPATMLIDYIRVWDYYDPFA